MTYLNTKIKTEITEAAVKQAGILDKESALVERRAAWAEAVRIDALGGKESAAKIERLNKRINKLLDEVPDSVRSGYRAFNREMSISVNVGGMRTEAHFSGLEKHFHPKSVHKISPYSHAIKGGTPLAKEFEAIEKDAGQLADQRATLEGNVRAALSRVRTVKQLLKEWPEAKALLPSNLDEAKAQLPAIQRKDLNKMIGLPAKEQPND